MLSSIVHDLVDEQGLPWHLGRQLSKIKKGDYSICYACKKREDPPETVAAPDEAAAPEDWRPMHLRCTVPHPRYGSLLFFDDLRMMEGR